MEVAAWCRESRVWVVAGKGGVGKTTVAATLARMAADAGLSTLVIELEGKQGLPAAFGRSHTLGYEPTCLYEATAPQGNQPVSPADASTTVNPAGAEGAEAAEGPAGAGIGTPGHPLPPGSVWARRLTPDDALLEYLADHGLQRVSKRLVSSGVLDVVATAIPGIRDVLVLGKVKQIERAGVADLVVVDAPATGHAMTFLTSASGLMDAARSGPLRTQAADVVELLQDPARCRVLLVTLPEEMPVSETVEAAFQLEDRVGVRLGPVVVNCAEEQPAGLATDVGTAAGAVGVELDPAVHKALERARHFRLRRIKLARQQVRRLGDDLPLPQLSLPRLASGSLGPVDLQGLARELAARVGALSARASAS